MANRRAWTSLGKVDSEARARLRPDLLQATCRRRLLGEKLRLDHAGSGVPLQTGMAHTSHARVFLDTGDPRKQQYGDSAYDLARGGWQRAGSLPR